MHDAREDRLLFFARREALGVLLLWCVALGYSVSYCVRYGYGREVASIEYVWGMPDWVAWGIALPWVVATLATVVFSLGVMRDDPLGEEAGEEEFSDEPELLPSPPADAPREPARQERDRG